MFVIDVRAIIAFHMTWKVLFHNDCKYRSMGTWAYLSSLTINVTHEYNQHKEFIAILQFGIKSNESKWTMMTA